MRFIRILRVRVREYSSAIPSKTAPINLPRLSRKLTPSAPVQTQASPRLAPLRDARGARFAHSASRVSSGALAATFRARRRASRTRPDPRERPLRRVARPGYHCWHPSVNNPPMSAPVESAEAHAGDDDESLTARCARWWHTPPPPPPPVRVRVPPTRTSPDRCAPPLLGCRQGKISPPNRRSNSEARRTSCSERRPIISFRCPPRLRAARPLPDRRS